MPGCWHKAAAVQALMGVAAGCWLTLFAAWCGVARFCCLAPAVKLGNAVFSRLLLPTRCVRQEIVLVSACQVSGLTMAGWLLAGCHC
jgi:hypothetical protein